MSENSIKARVVGIDMGTQTTTFAVVDIRGNIVAKDHFATTDYTDINEYVSALSEKIVMLVEENGGYETIRSVGISAPSGNFVTGSIENAVNLPWKGHIPMTSMLRDRLGLAVALGNDAHVAAVGEKAYGLAHGMSDFAVVTFGHGGLGSSLYLNGKSHLGADGFAGELGHTCVVENGRLCGCGRRGCLEEYASIRGIIQTARELKAQGRSSVLPDEGEVTAQAVAEACAQGDEVVLEALRQVGEMLGYALANLVSLIDPEAIILTGDMLTYNQWMMEDIQRSFDANIFQNLRGKVKILISNMDNGERDLLGASALAWEVKEYSLFK